MKKSAGFTMIELLVTLVLLGLITSMAVPGIDSWLRARQASSVRIALSNEMTLLPLQAKMSGQRLQLSEASQLSDDSLPLRFIEPVIVLPNGYCLGGQVALMQNSTAENLNETRFDILPPLCEVRRHDS
jgi:prepilin-type N-terminal cleavage/methylation domain-containing protein